jgi:hypothetical protein
MQNSTLKTVLHAVTVAIFGYSGNTQPVQCSVVYSLVALGLLDQLHK